MVRSILLMLAASIVSGCAHVPLSLNQCALPKVPLSLTQPRMALGAMTPATEPASGYEQLLLDSLKAPPGALRPLAAERPRFLFLSGGSQDGAFGAGLLDEWRIKAGSLPKFRTVTGISTGALIGTTVFTGHSDKAIEGYTIADESELLQVQARGLIGIVRHGAAGTLVPLRRKIDRLLDSSAGVDDDLLLMEMADASLDEGRKFIIGTVDLRGGEAWAIDMTSLAERWKAAGAAEKPAIKGCFIEALIASASVPGAAPPTYIDDVMYIDGGARFGLFRGLEDSALLRAAQSGPAPIAFRIVNGRWSIREQCPYVEGRDGSCSPGPLKKWDFASTAQRSVSVLINSVYRFSAVTAGRPGDPAPAYIEDDADTHPFTWTRDAASAPETLGCGAWRKIDEADKPRPVEFHKREMRCLIDYGRTRMDALKWWEVR